MDVKAILALPAPKEKELALATSSLLQNIQLDKMIANMEEAAHLLYIAYNAATGFGTIKKNIFKLHDDYGDICAQSQRDLAYFSEESRRVQGSLQKMAEYFGKGDLVKVIEPLKRGMDSAEKLSKRAGALATRFNKLGDTTIVVCQDILTEGGQQQLLQEMNEENILRLEIEEKKANVVSEGYEKGRKILQKEYEDAREKAQVANDRAFIIAYGKNVLVPLALGAGNVASLYLNPGLWVLNKGGAVANHVIEHIDDEGGIVGIADNFVKKITVQEEVEKIRFDLEEVQKKIADLKKQLEMAEEALKGHIKKLEDLNAKFKDSNNKADLDIERASILKFKELAQKEFDDVLEKLKKAQRQEAKLQADLKEQESALSICCDLLKKMGGGSETGQEYEEVAAEARRERTKYLEFLIQQEEKEYQEKSKLLELARKIGSTKKDTELRETARSALTMACNALRSVAAVLREASHFWALMQQTCKSFTDPQITKDLEMFKSEAAEEIAELIQAVGIDQKLYEIYVKWVAIGQICEGFAVRTENIHKQILSDFKKRLPDEKALDDAIESSKKLVIKIEEDQKTRRKRVEAILRFFKK